MARSSTAGEDTVLAATERKTHYRVDIADPAGVMVDASSIGGFNWVVGADLDENIDQSVASMTVTLRRESDITLGQSSLSPLRSDSPVNVTGAAVDVFRAVKYYEATVTGSRPAAASTDWKLKFDGVTDRVSMPDRNEVILACRDKGAFLIDQWVRDPGANIAGPGNPRPLEDVINDLLKYAPVDDVVQTVSVNGTWTSPGYAVTSFPLKSEPTMTAIQRAAELAVADFRYAWNDTDGAYKFTLTIPDRASPSSVATFGDADIVGWRSVDRDRLGVRNQIILSYKSRTDGVRRLEQAEDATSIADFGRRVLTISEADDSSIDTAEEAADMVALIVADLKDPKVVAECEMLPDWRLELNDYVTFSGNRYFDVAQDVTIVGIRRSMRPDSQRMTLSLRGNPSAGYQRWRARAKDLDVDNPTPADNGLTAFTYTDDDTAGTRRYEWTRGANVAFVGFYEALVTAPVTVSPFPDPSTVASSAIAGTSGYSILPSATDSWVATKPPRGKQRVGMLVPYYKGGGRYLQGDAIKVSLDPLPSAMNAALYESVGTSTDTATDLVLWVQGSPSDWPVTVEVWQGEESGAADFSYTLSANSVDADATAMHLKALALPYIEHRTWSVKATNVAGEIVRSALTESRALFDTQCRATVTAVSATQVTVTVTGIGPNTTPTVGYVGLTGNTTLASGHAAGTYTYAQNGTDNVWVFNRGAFGSGPGQAQFRSVVSGGPTDDDFVEIPEQGRDTVYLAMRARVTAVTATTLTVRVAVADPYPQGAASVTIALSETGTGAATSPATGQTVTPVATITEAAGTYVDYTVTRPAFGVGAGRVTFTATAANRTSDSDAVDVPEVDRDTVPLAIRARITASTSTTVTVRVAVADPFPQGADTATIAYTETGGTGTACSPASGGTVTPAATLTEAASTYIDYTVTRPAYNTGSRRVTFTATATSRVSASDAVDVPASEQDAEPSLVLGIGNNQSTSDLTAKAFATVSAPSNATSIKWLASTSSQPSAASVISGGTVLSTGAPNFSIADLGVTLSLGDTVYFTAVYYDATGARTNVQGAKTRENINASKTTRLAAVGLFSPYSPSTQTYDTTNGYYHTTGEQGNNCYIPLPKGVTLTAVRARVWAASTTIQPDYWAGFLYRVNESGTVTQLGSEFDSGTTDAWETIAVTSLTEDTSGDRSYKLTLTSVHLSGTRTADYRIAWIEYDMTIPNLFVG